MRVNRASELRRELRVELRVELQRSFGRGLANECIKILFGEMPILFWTEQSPTAKTTAKMTAKLHRFCSIRYENRLF